MSNGLQHNFLSAMRRLATTVSIVTSSDGDGWHGMTATAVTSVCADPAAVLVCINSNSAFRRGLSEGGRFCVNLLRSSQAELSANFSGRMRGSERFGVGAWRADESGLPYLADAQAILFCSIDKIVPYGTHEVFITRVDAARFANDVSPLIYQDGQYAMTTLMRRVEAKPYGASAGVE